jgi:hypothetical protein
VSPRTLSKLNAVRQAGIPKDLEVTVYTSILGQHWGSAFYKFINKESPVFYMDLVNNEKKALDVLKKHTNPNDYKSGHVSMTVRSIIDDGAEEITPQLLGKLVDIIPLDQMTTIFEGLQIVRPGITKEVASINKSLKRKIMDMHNKSF